MSEYLHYLQLRIVKLSRLCKGTGSKQPQKEHFLSSDTGRPIFLLGPQSTIGVIPRVQFGVFISIVPQRMVAFWQQIKINLVSRFTRNTNSSRILTSILFVRLTLLTNVSPLPGYIIKPMAALQPNLSKGED